MSTKHSPTKHTNHLAEAAEETAGEAGDRLTAAFENTKQFVTNARDKAVATAKAADHAVHEHPYKSLAVVAGVGLLFGYFMGRRGCAKANADQD